MTIDPTVLQPGEKLLWSGKPDPRRYAVAKGFGHSLAGILVLAFAWLWTAAAAKDGPVALAGLVVFVIGGALLAAPLWHLSRARRTLYALTDRRAITETDSLHVHRISVPLSQIYSVELTARSDGFGDVKFQEVVLRGSENTVAGREGFLAIADAEKVERLFMTRLAGAQQPASAQA